MRILNFSPVDPNMGATRTYEHFYKFLGAAPHRLGLVARMYSDQTLLFLTEALANVYYTGDDKKMNRFQNINNMMFEWELETNFIKRVPFAAVPVDDGAEGTEITMAFTENYYQKYDIFVIEDSRQQCQVVSRPVRKGDAYFEVQVRLIDNDFNSVLDANACHKGSLTHFISNAHPELSEEGWFYIALLSNFIFN